jgi:hypothetical protein
MPEHVRPSTSCASAMLDLEISPDALTTELYTDAVAACMVDRLAAGPHRRVRSDFH